MSEEPAMRESTPVDVGIHRRSSIHYETVVRDVQWPIIYSPEYRIRMCCLEKLHPFVVSKWSRIFKYLRDARMINDDTIVKPEEATEDELMLVHNKTYLMSLEAARLAMERGWAINLGGGFTHSCHNEFGYCSAYADITLAIRFAFKKFVGVSKVMIIDLDAHQGNGYEKDFMKDERVYIFDMYNRNIYPQDEVAKCAIQQKVELKSYTDTETYLDLVRIHLQQAFTEFVPDLVAYNAGADILEGDSKGNLSVSAEGIEERDRIVFEKCRTQKIPIFMVVGGGFQQETPRVVANSILNLRKLDLISCEAAEKVVKQCSNSALGNRCTCLRYCCY